MTRDFSPLVEAGLLAMPGSLGNHDADYTAAVKLAYIIGLRNADSHTQCLVVGVAPSETSELVTSMRMPSDVDVSSDGDNLQALPLVTIIHGPIATNLGRITDAFGIPRGYNTHAIYDNPGDNDPEEERGLVEALEATDFLLLQADLVEMGSHSLAGAAALVVQNGHDGIGYVGYFDQEYQKVPDPWWITRT